MEEIIKILIGGQIDRDEAHAKELEKRKKDRKKELSNFHKIYAEKMKRQEQKYVVEILKVIEDCKTRLKEEQELIQVVKEDRDYCIK